MTQKNQTDLPARLGRFAATMAAIFLTYTPKLSEPEGVGFQLLHCTGGRGVCDLSDRRASNSGAPLGRQVEVRKI